MRHRLAGVLLAVLTLAPLGGRAEPVDEDALVRRVTEAVLKALEKDGRLQEAIQQGIARYVEQQKQARAAAYERARQAAAEQAKEIRKVSAQRDRIRGDPSAPISLVEYSDFECPYCKRFHATARAAIEAYPGKVNWVYRYFPLEMHNPHAEREAQAAECAHEQGGNDTFWRFADTLYARTRSNKGFPLNGLVPLAAELGLDEGRFRACLESGRYAARVKEDLDEGQRIGIAGTPGNVLVRNDTGEVRVVSGAVPLSQLREAIDAMLAESD